MLNNIKKFWDSWDETIYYFGAFCIILIGVYLAYHFIEHPKKKYNIENIIIEESKEIGYLGDVKYIEKIGENKYKIAVIDSNGMLYIKIISINNIKLEKEN